MKTLLLLGLILLASGQILHPEKSTLEKKEHYSELYIPTAKEGNYKLYYHSLPQEWKEKNGKLEIPNKLLSQGTGHFLIKVVIIELGAHSVSRVIAIEIKGKDLTVSICDQYEIKCSPPRKAKHLSPYGYYDSSSESTSDYLKGEYFEYESETSKQYYEDEYYSKKKPGNLRAYDHYDYEEQVYYLIKQQNLQGLYALIEKIKAGKGDCLEKYSILSFIVAEVEKSFESHRYKKTELQKLLITLELEYTTYEKQIYGYKQKRGLDYHPERYDYKDKIERHNEKLKSLWKKIQKYQAEYDEYSYELETLERCKRGGSNYELEELERQQKYIDKEIYKLEETIYKLKEKKKQIAAKIYKLERSQGDCDKGSSYIASRIRQIKGKLKEIYAYIEEYKLQEKDWKDEIQKWQGYVRDTKYDNYDGYDGYQVHIIEKIKQIEKQITLIRKKEEECKYEIKSCDSYINGIGSEIHLIRRKVDDFYYKDCNSIDYYYDDKYEVIEEWHHGGKKQPKQGYCNGQYCENNYRFHSDAFIKYLNNVYGKVDFSNIVTRFDKDIVEITEYDILSEHWRNKYGIAYKTIPAFSGGYGSNYDITSELVAYDNDFKCHEDSDIIAQNGKISEVVGNLIKVEGYRGDYYDLELATCTRFQGRSGKTYPEIGDEILFKGRKHGDKYQIYSATSF